MNQFCQNLPKIELHAHLNGSLSTETLITLGCVNESIQTYQKLNGLLQRDSRTLEECFHLFKVAHHATNTKQAIYKATRDVIKEFHGDNVIYLELRTTPRATEDMTKEEYVKTVIKAIEDNRDSIIIKLLLCIDRRHDLSVSENVMELIIKMKNKYPQIVKGVDLCGNPSVGIFNSNLFEKARTNELKLSLHCAEVKNDEEVKDILDFKPDRIGHGTCIHPNFGGSEDLWEIYVKNKIPTEMFRKKCAVPHCPSAIYNPETRYFCFPANAVLCQRWIDVIGNPFHGTTLAEIRNRYSVCSEHFAIEQYQTPERLKLNRKQLPRLCLPLDSNVREIAPVHNIVHQPEMCLTSNVICGTSKNYKEHHISEWIRNDFPMTLSTDDKGVFNTTLTKECQLLQEHFNLSETDLWRMSFNSIDHSFSNDEEKDYLKKIMLNWKSKNIK